ncbi:MAG: type III-A CRISPR-associated protein Cas10/Csm1 [Candidatus Fervidibacter sp.]|uniref:type III-A CRISPR-associated protein Cas10/Csm1 n=1 Tax=Candidatus Fervidibacter sp. TaxID=3100871 RepID=UPI004048EBFF
MDEEVFFPTGGAKVEPGDYRRAWDEFTETLRNLPSNLPFLVWQTLLQVYTHAIPSATPWEKEPEKRTVPDISLFHHARLIAAIAACLASLNLPPNELSQLLKLLSQFAMPDFEMLLRSDSIGQKPLCLLVRGDVAGIQSWLYRIARAEGEEHRKTAKRLRGRSFLLILLTEAVARWICQKANLLPCNILFCGGGVFDVLLPANAEQNIENWQEQLDNWLLDEFHGELRLNLAWVKVTAADFYDFGSVHRKVTAELERNKQKALSSHLDKDNFWFQEVADICRFCDTTPFAEPTEPCKQCKLQESLGDGLRRTGEVDYIVWAWGGARKALSDKSIVNFDGLGCDVTLVSESEAKNIVNRWNGEGELIIGKRNDPQNWWLPLTWDGKRPVQTTIWWVASDAPVAKKRWKAPTKPVDDPEAIVHK